MVVTINCVQNAQRTAADNALQFPVIRLSHGVTGTAPLPLERRKNTDACLLVREWGRGNLDLRTSNWETMAPEA